ncbi:MAG: hypothetical protein JWL60_2247 [Gemmatimonadetes bacterium]|nr:hypothetical protein [Gemmatimonadota bacterium]
MTDSPPLEAPTDATVLHTTVGDFPLHEYRTTLADRDWSILHTGAVLTAHDEAEFLHVDSAERQPYAIVLWGAAVALAHDIASRPDDFRGRSVLEIGAGTGLPGLIAASAGARVLQTDQMEVALAMCRRNAARNRVEGLRWAKVAWEDGIAGERFDWILGADVAYARGAHGALRTLLRGSLAPGGRVLLADPFRAASLPLLQALASEDGWRVALSKWTVGVGPESRPVGIYELTSDPVSGRPAAS